MQKSSGVRAYVKFTIGVLKKNWELRMKHKRAMQVIRFLRERVSEDRYSLISCFSCKYGMYDNVCDCCTTYDKWVPGDQYTGYRGPMVN